MSPEELVGHIADELTGIHIYADDGEHYVISTDQGQDGMDSRMRISLTNDETRDVETFGVIVLERR